MKLITLFGAFALCSPAWTQVAAEDFDQPNTDGWSVNGAVAAPQQTSGGNPGGYLALNGMGSYTASRSSVLPFDFALPTVAGQPFAGDLRALGANRWSMDSRRISGDINDIGALFLLLGDDNGTATLDDDAFAYVAAGGFFGTLGWSTSEVLIPVESTTVTGQWIVIAGATSPMAGQSADTLWNSIVQDVDYFGVGVQSYFPGTPFDVGLDNLLLEQVGPNPIQSYCPDIAQNSTGFPTQLLGSFSSPGGTGLLLSGFNGPAGEFGYMLIGSAADPVGVPLSNGKLCLSTAAPNGVARYNVAGTSLNSMGAFNPFGLFVNQSGTSPFGFGFEVPSQLPAALGTNISAGQTWHFQLWHRDTPAGPGQSNLSNGLTVTF